MMNRTRPTGRSACMTGKWCKASFTAPFRTDSNPLVLLSFDLPGARGAWHGTFVAITLAAPILLINGFFGKRPWKHLLIHIFFWIITLALTGGILDAMNHWENVVLPDG